MRFLVACMLAILPAAAGAVDHKSPNPPKSELLAERSCPQGARHYAYRTDKPLKPQKLGELPPGNMYIAVYRTDSKGCEDPIVVKYGVGQR